MSTISVISYNITASFFDGRDKTSDKRHTWAYRSKYVKEAIEKYLADVICLQELSPEQATEIHEYFSDNYNSFFLSQSVCEIGAGVIEKGENVHKWVGKYMGATPTGILVKKSIKILDTGRFWLSENPEEVPVLADRGETDKGFGNINTHRAVLWTKLEMNDEPVFIFNSHYPLSGDNKKRLGCAQLERKMIDKITSSCAFVSVGDRNFIECEDDFNPHEALVEGLDDVFEKSSGINTTWLGFSYDNFQTGVDLETGVFDGDTKLDVPISNMETLSAEINHCAIDPDEGKLVNMGEPLTEKHHEGRYFASDHALVFTKFDVNNHEHLMNKIRELYQGHELEGEIEDCLLWMDFYKSYSFLSGFMRAVLGEPKLQVPGINLKLYLPHFIYYLRKRCARIFFVYVGEGENVPKYVVYTMYEGHTNDFDTCEGKMTEEIYEDGHALALYEWNVGDTRQFVDDWIQRNPTDEKYFKGFLYNVIMSIHDCDKKDSEGFEFIDEHSCVKVIDGKIMAKCVGPGASVSDELEELCDCDYP